MKINTFSWLISSIETFSSLLYVVYGVDGSYIIYSG